MALNHPKCDENKQYYEDMLTKICAKLGKTFPGFDTYGISMNNDKRNIMDFIDNASKDEDNPFAAFIQMEEV